MQTNYAITVGPVIGKVTPYTARVLAEFNFQGQVSCYLTNPMNQSTYTTLNVPANKPVVFSFSNLAPTTTYMVTFNPNLPQVPSSFRTLSDKKDPQFHFATVSCNDIGAGKKKQEQSDLWLDIYKRAVKGEIDYLFHVGDQVYMDMGEDEVNIPYKTICEILKDIPQKQWNSKREQCLDILRSKYRETWGHKSTRLALANIPSLTILDDHEVRDCFGFREEDYDPKSSKPDYWYLGLAQIVYYEYQRQLREDIDFNDLSKIKEEFYYEILNGVGVVFVEYRAIRTWHREKNDSIEYSQIGSAQWRFFRSLFDDNGIFSKVTNAILCSPLVMIIFGVKETKLAALKIKDAKENWTYKYSDEQHELLDLFQKWRKKDKAREITMVCGDIHIGGHTDIYYKGKPCFKQLVTSAVNQKAIKKIEFMVVKLLADMSDKMGGGYEFKHNDFIKCNNFALVNVIPDANGSLHTCQLVGAENGEKVQEFCTHSSKKYGESPHLANSSACCNMF